jgi:hypothetical protein
LGEVGVADSTDARGSDDAEVLQPHTSNKQALVIADLARFIEVRLRERALVVLPDSSGNSRKSARSQAAQVPFFVRRFVGISRGLNGVPVAGWSALNSLG